MKGFLNFEFLVRQAIEGFPDGLPDLTPLGVKISLENMLGKDTKHSCDNGR